MLEGGRAIWSSSGSFAIVSIILLSMCSSWSATDNIKKFAHIVHILSSPYAHKQWFCFWQILNEMGDSARDFSICKRLLNIETSKLWDWGYLF